MTRGELLTQLYRRLNKAETPDTATKNRLVGFLNEVYREALSWPGMQRLRDDTLTFASVANQARYALPWVPKVNRLFEATNDRLLQPMTLADYRLIDPDPESTTGTPDAWIWAGYAPVAKQPSDASRIFIKSTSASDTNTVFLEGETSGGYPRAVSKTMTGTTAVDVDTAITDWVRVTKVYLSAAAVGTVTLHEDSGTGTELARIGIGQTSQRYCYLYLYPTPSSAITYTADVVQGITDLSQDTEEPRLPQDFHDLLVHGAMLREYEKTDDGRYTNALQRFEQRKRDLMYWLAETAQSPVRVPGGGRSRLGPWYPAGS